MKYLYKLNEKNLNNFKFSFFLKKILYYNTKIV